MGGYFSDEATHLRLLEFAPFERRAGGWRWGARRICTRTVERLIASGRVVVEGDRLRLIRLEAS